MKRTGTGRSREVADPRLWVHIHVNMELGGFEFAGKFIGWKGENTARINKLTKAKIRVRGKGSGHLENGSEACGAFVP